MARPPGGQLPRPAARGPGCSPSLPARPKAGKADPPASGRPGGRWPSTCTSSTGMPNWSSGKSNSNLPPQYIPPGETGLVRPAPRLAARAGQPGLLPAGVPAVEDGGVVVGGRRGASAAPSSAGPSSAAPWSAVPSSAAAVVGGAVVGGAVVGGADDLVGLGVDDDVVGLGEGSRPGFGAVWVGEPAPPDPGDVDVLLAGRVGSTPEVGSTPTGVTGGGLCSPIRPGRPLARRAAGRAATPTAR